MRVIIVQRLKKRYIAVVIRYTIFFSENVLHCKFLLQDDKKMIRYRDGKIVSTKGERYTQVTKAESEEMKKSIVINS